MIISNSSLSAQPETGFLTNIIEAITYGIVVIDPKWQVTIWNTAAREIVGYSASKMIGSDLRTGVKLIREQDRQADYSAIEAVFNDGKEHKPNQSVIIQTKNQTEVPITYTASPIFNREGDVNGAVIVFRDLTAERAAFGLKSDFTYLQHQLRTPIVSALWNLESVFQSKTLDEASRNKLNISLIAMESIKALFNRIIDVSQVDQGLVAPKEQEVSVSEMIGKAILTVSDLAKAKSIKIEVEPAEVKEKITTDPVYFTKILEEIIRNAVSYSPPSSDVKIKISPSESGLLFEVSDKGVGILTEENSLIFHKFFRGSNISHDVAGAGLGLYMTMRYVKLLKGKIWFISQPNQGTTFSVYLPVSKT